MDLIVMNSVAQYLAPEEFDALLAIFYRLVWANGLLVIGDVVPAHTSVVSDALALLRPHRHPATNPSPRDPVDGGDPRWRRRGHRRRVRSHVHAAVVILGCGCGRD